MLVVAEMTRLQTITTTTTNGTETANIDAEKIVNANCIACHGQNLEGASGPALNRRWSSFIKR